MSFATVLLLVVSADPAATCADRACLVAAANECKPATGELATADLLNMAGGQIKGTTALSIKPGGTAAACTLMVSVKVTEAPAVPKHSPKDVLKILNGSVKNRLQCEASGSDLAALVETIGTDSIKATHLASCFTTQCDPKPPLLKGCTAGPCVRGAYEVKCGEHTCKMTGFPKDELSGTATFPQVYSCGENGSIVFQDPKSAAKKK